MKDSQRKAIHASRKKATNKAKTLGSRTFKTKGGSVTVQAKTQKALIALRKAKSVDDL